MLFRFEYVNGVYKEMRFFLGRVYISVSSVPRTWFVEVKQEKPSSILLTMLNGSFENKTVWFYCEEGANQYCLLKGISTNYVNNIPF